MKPQKVLLGVLAGVAAGALLGVLFAPDQGVKTRRKITGKGEAFADSIKDKFNEFLDVIAEKFEMVKAESSNLAKHAKEMKKEEE
jgi:gas vesicle protein